MTDIEKVNEELRNYKLFKIQRILTREQEFSQCKNDLVVIRKNEVFTYILHIINIIAVIFLCYCFYHIFIEKDDIKKYAEVIIANTIIVLILAIYFIVRYMKLNKSLQQHIGAVDRGIQYFSNEAEKLKSNYENYVDVYLEQQKLKK